MSAFRYGKRLKSFTMADAWDAPTPGAKHLELVHFGVAFDTRVVLRDISFSLPVRGCTVLLGPSGTGKSTLLRMLAGCNDGNPLLRTWGTALLEGQPCAPGNRPALMVQNPRLLVSSIFENLVCDLPGRAQLTRPMQRARVMQVLTEFGQLHLAPALDSTVMEHSSSNQRIIALLRIALTGAPLFLIDEPTTDLSPEGSEPVLRLIEQLARTHSVLVVLHHLQQAQRLADQVLLMANGVIEEAAPGNAFFFSPTSALAKAFLRTGSCPEQSQLQAQQPPLPLPLPADLPKPPAKAATARSAASGPRGFYWLLPGQLAGCPWPGVVQSQAQDLAALQSVGITRLINLTEKEFDPALAQRYGMECTFSPMPDMAAPSVQQALGLCRLMDECIASGETVAIHCRAGLGRTGTVLAAYWLWQGAGEVTAVSALQALRGINSGWVQSTAQIDFLEMFAMVVASGKGG